jgi:two-component system, probable response regulator PhcQ
MDRSVLLVDDDKNLLAGLVRILHKQPFHIYTARCGEEAIDFLKTRDIDVIVADERMPGMSGVELLTWVAENCPEVMRIVLTGHAQAETAIRAINDAGVCYFFTKPCNEARLAVTIRRVLERKASLEDGQHALESCRRKLIELDRLSQDVRFQARIVSQDLQRPIERILECCRHLEEQTGPSLDAQSQSLLADAQSAAAEARRLVLQLQNAAMVRNSPGAKQEASSVS